MARLRRYAQDRGLALAGEFVERGVSGTNDNRPEFRRMLEEIYRPNSEVGMVIVTHGSRFMPTSPSSESGFDALVPAL